MDLTLISLIFYALLIGTLARPQQQPVNWRDLFVPVPNQQIPGQQTNPVLPSQFGINNNNNNNNNNNINNPGGTATSAPIESTTSAQYRNCLRTCPTTSEYNPICGDDEETYSNSGQLRCAQFCGRPVQLLRLGTCQPL